jgi:hypothetical protein
MIGPDAFWQALIYRKSLLQSCGRLFFYDVVLPCGRVVFLSLVFWVIKFRQEAVKRVSSGKMA